jgi:hypothetical protein
MTTIPGWLVLVSAISVILHTILAFVIALDIAIAHRQKMWIMNIVWPVTALYGGLVALWAYYRVGLTSAHYRKTGEPVRPGAKQKPFWQTAALASTHCGSGCTLGDIIAELGLASLVPAILGSELLGSWAADFVLAFMLGIVFQYFTITPMKHLSFGKGLLAALKADTLSLVAWQIGMYGWMAIAIFLIFGERLPPTSMVFWFMMQMAMIFGFMTSYPVNWWLVRNHVKEEM